MKCSTDSFHTTIYISYQIGMRVPYVVVQNPTLIAPLSYHFLKRYEEPRFFIPRGKKHRIHRRQTCYQGQKLVETGRRKRMRGPDQYAMLGALRHAHQWCTRRNKPSWGVGAWRQQGWDEYRATGPRTTLLEGNRSWLDGLLWLSWGNLGRGWVGTQGSHGGRECLLSTTWSYPWSPSGKRRGVNQLTETGTSCDSPYFTSPPLGDRLALSVRQRGSP
jgi:hypothetical protein